MAPENKIMVDYSIKSMKKTFLQCKHSIIKLRIRVVSYPHKDGEAIAVCLK